MTLLFSLTLLVTYATMVARCGDDGTITDSNEDDDNSAFRFISLKGTISRWFALTTAVDNQEKNVICSPLSALIPLGKLAVGAKDEALAELLSAIGLSRRSKLESHFKPLIEDLKYLPGVRLDVASRIYVSSDEQLQKQFIDKTTQIFNSSVEKMDFTQPDVAADKINAWVSRNTNSMINEILSPWEIPPYSSLILVNAIYFSGQWKEAFEKVHSDVFFTPAGEKYVDMMTRQGWYNFIRSDVLGAQLVEIPYKENGASFVILLPYKRNGLPALLSQLKLASDLLNSELSRMRKLKVTLTIPKFQMESELNLRDLFKKIGLQAIFNKYNSGLNGIIRDRSVFLSYAKQKASIQVTENGTRASAVSVSQMIGMSMDIHKEIVNCNHPFLFFIKAYKQQLFVGILNYP